MSGDVARELASIRASEQAAARSREGFVASWKRLRALRDGLAAELAAGLAAIPARETDPDRLHAEMRAPIEARLRLAREQADAAEALLGRAGLFGNGLRPLSPRWWAERRVAAAHALALREEADALADGFPGLDADLWARARARADENRRERARAAKPLEPLRDRVAALDAALDAIDAGDASAIACVARWDVPAAMRVARTWRRLRDDGFVSDADLAFYHAARDPAPAHWPPAHPPPGGGTVLVRRVTEDIVVLPRGDPGWVEGEFREVPPEDPRAIAYVPPGDDRGGD